MYRHRPRRHFSGDERESPHLDRWLVSYADYMTLMFALFVVLYSLALLKEEQYEVLSQTLEKVFETRAEKDSGVKGEGLLHDNLETDTPLDLYGSSILDIEGPELTEGKVDVSNITEQKLGHPLASLAQQLDNALFDVLQSGLAEVQLKGDWLTIELNSNLLFASGSATATGSAKLVLSKIYDIVGPVNNYVRVRGYTDDRPINTELYSSNWELSVARATSVLRILEQLSLNPARMAIEGYGQYSPFDHNNTASGRSNNRKVVIALSKYAWQRPVKQPDGELDSKNQKNSQKTGDHDQVQVIELSSGGIRMTTRRDDRHQTDKQNDQHKVHE